VRKKQKDGVAMYDVAIWQALEDIREIAKQK
jgi:hypothetical protein